MTDNTSNFADTLEALRRELIDDLIGSDVEAAQCAAPRLPPTWPKSNVFVVESGDITSLGGNRTSRYDEWSGRNGGPWTAQTKTEGSHHVTPPACPDLNDLRNLSVAQLKLLRRKFALLHHPDRSSPSCRAEATRYMSEINGIIDAALRERRSPADLRD